MHRGTSFVSYDFALEKFHGCERMHVINSNSFASGEHNAAREKLSDRFRLLIYFHVQERAGIYSGQLFLRTIGRPFYFCSFRTRDRTPRLFCPKRASIDICLRATRQTGRNAENWISPLTIWYTSHEAAFETEECVFHRFPANAFPFTTALMWFIPLQLPHGYIWWQLDGW